MDPSFDFYFEPRDMRPGDLTAGVRSIQFDRTGEATLALDPDQTRLDLRQEHPPVERMEGDLGAICEVFRQSSSYFLSLSGVSLVPGDRLTLTYRHKPYRVILTVVALENGAARIDPPVVQAHGA